jgi:hypothetical protein
MLRRAGVEGAHLKFFSSKRAIFLPVAYFGSQKCWYKVSDTDSKPGDFDTRPKFSAQDLQPNSKCGAKGRDLKFFSPE